MRRNYRRIISVALLLLSWAALDDITTDPSPTHAVEYVALAAAAAWFLVEAARVYGGGHRVLSVGAMVLVTSGIAGVVGLSRTADLVAHPAPWHVVAVMSALAGCLALTVGSASKAVPSEKI